VDDKASRFDVKSLELEISKINHGYVTDKYISHLVVDESDGIKNVHTNIGTKDTLSNVGVRLGFNRYDYKVPPGLYSVGRPGKDSNVIVSSNYKLTFDSLRKELDGMNVWILILDTDGVNVWCAAGKGSFGTAELVYSIRNSGLEDKVNHKNLILPQLAAPGIQSHLVTQLTGFKVNFGTVRAEDIRKYIENGFKADEVMRQVNFGFVDRVVLTPLEIFISMKYVIGMFLLFALYSVVAPTFGLVDAIRIGSIYLVGTLTGTLLLPALLPALPFKMFYRNGLLLGFASVLGYIKLIEQVNVLFIGNGLVAMAFCSYLAMNFTGSTTYTSLSGVKYEMEKGLPFLGVLLAIGILTTVAGMIMGVIG